MSLLTPRPHSNIIIFHVSHMLISIAIEVGKVGSSLAHDEQFKALQAQTEETRVLCALVYIVMYEILFLDSFMGTLTDAYNGMDLDSQAPTRLAPCTI